jgi:uncharacterized Tic20 family protein
MSSGSVRLEDNSRRGARAMFFLKFWYIISIVALVLCNVGIEITHQFPPAAFEGMDKAAVMQFYYAVQRLYRLFMADMTVMLGALVVSALMGVLFSVYWILWLYRAVKNLRCLTKTFFSPAAALVCPILPDIGYFIGIFILWDIARRQQKLLDGRGIQYTPVTRRAVAIFIVFMLLGNIVVYEEVGATWPGCFAACASLIGIMVSWLRVLRPCVEQGNMLYKLHEEDVLRAKVDEVLREREIEKAAREIQEAKFDE